MNKVKYFSAEYGYQLENEINKFAEKHEIIQVSFNQSNYAHTAGAVKAIVLYRE